MSSRFAGRIAACSTVVALTAFAAAAESIVTADALLRDAAFKASYLAALGTRSRTKWLATLENSAPVATVRAGGEDWQQVTPCKPHDCADNNLLLLWSPTRKAVRGRLYERGRATSIGEVDPAFAAELERLWKKEFRQQ